MNNQDKQDLTLCNVQDLTDIVFKDSYFHYIRHHDELEEILNDSHKFTSEQFDHLTNTLEEDYLT